MNQVLMIPPEKLGNLTNVYKERITSDPTLTTATQLAATRHKLLKNKKIPPGIKQAKDKALGSTFNKVVRKYKRGPFTSNITAPPDSTDSIIQEDEQSKAFQRLLLNLLRGQQPAKKTVPKVIRKKSTTKKTKKTEAQKLISDWLPYNTRSQQWQRRTRSS